MLFFDNKLFAIERLSDFTSITFPDAVDHLEEGGISIYNPAAREELKLKIKEHLKKTC